MEGKSPFLGGGKMKTGRLGKGEQADVGGSAPTQCDLEVTSPLGTTVSSSSVEAGRAGYDKQVQH